MLTINRNSWHYRALHTMRKFHGAAPYEPCNAYRNLCGYAQGAATHLVLWPVVTGVFGGFLVAGAHVISMCLVSAVYLAAHDFDVSYLESIGRSTYAEAGVVGWGIVLMAAATAVMSGRPTFGRRGEAVAAYIARRRKHFCPRIEYAAGDEA